MNNIFFNLKVIWKKKAITTSDFSMIYIATLCVNHQTSKYIRHIKTTPIFLTKEETNI